MDNKFIHTDLRMVEPKFDSNLTDIILELEKLRTPRRLRSRVHPFIFSQLKEIFHKLESLGSVRIEGNNTTLSDVIEKTIDGTIEKSKEEQHKEFQNNQLALDFIEKNISEGTIIDRKIISELHKIVVGGLDPSVEGDYSPGECRIIEVKIQNAQHKPPMAVKVPEYMEELIAFINESRSQKYKLLATAVAHHRFAWIHPFRNGNGRTVRLLTYSMLMSQGFAVNHIINPTVVFCNARDIYYKTLSAADAGTENGILGWCEYVLSNLLEEIKKIDRLLDYDYLVPNILVPALSYALSRKTINQEEFSILKMAIEKGELRASDINIVIKKSHHAQVSAYIKKLKNEGLLLDAPGKKRSYVISFSNNHLLRGVIDALRRGGFVGGLE